MARPRPLPQPGRGAAEQGGTCGPAGLAPNTRRHGAPSRRVAGPDAGRKVWPESYKQPLFWPAVQSPGPQFQLNPVPKVPWLAFLPEASMLCLSFFLQILLLLVQDTGPSPAHV
uniref:Uncharacterized protein n=2 Tax=Cercopithecinae TaxID=9528 RepID=A0A7N9CWG7_MACFA